VVEDDEFEGDLRDVLRKTVGGDEGEEATLLRAGKRIQLHVQPLGRCGLLGYGTGQGGSRKHRGKKKGAYGHGLACLAIGLRSAESAGRGQSSRWAPELT